MEAVHRRTFSRSEAGAFARTIKANSEGAGFKLQWKTWERNKKKKLRSHRRDDPDIRIELPVDRDVYFSSLGTLGYKVLKKSGREVNKVDDHKFLNDIFGAKWDFRVVNRNGDFEYVKEKSVEFWLAEREPIEQFELIGGKFFESRLEQEPIVVFTFVAKTGNKRQFFNKFGRQ